jgi:HAE1 family hydrophobic/amphiphilic exporter-1
VQTSPEYRALPGYIEVVCKKNNRDEMVPFSAFMDGKVYGLSEITRHKYV